MKLDKQALEKLLNMSRLGFLPDEKKKLPNHLHKITDWVKQLEEVDTTGVAPLMTVSGELNKLREDVPIAPLSSKKALLNAPKQDGAYFLVPAVSKKK